jgi:hypothetical protein
MNKMNDAEFDSRLGASPSRPIEPDELDVLLDRALGSYTAGEPRPGFAARIFASTRAARQRRPRTRRAWAIAVSGWAVAAAVTILFLRVQPIELVIAPHSSHSEMARNAPSVLQHSAASAPAVNSPMSPPPVRAAVRVHAQRPDQTVEVEPIVFDPISIAPIRIGAMH